MRKAFLVFSVLAVLAVPAANAALRDDDPHGRDRGGFISRIARIIKALEDITVSWPKP